MTLMNASELHKRSPTDPDFINRGMQSQSGSATPSVPTTGAQPSAAADEPAPVVIDRDPASYRLATINLIETPSFIASEAKPTRRGPMLPVVAIWMLAVIVAALIGSGYYALTLRHTANRVVPKSTATPTPLPTVTPTLTPAPVTPPPTPPAPAAVTVPATTPTVAHPQSVIVKSPSGLWLRSSPDSSGRQNIIGWMPNGAGISVDQEGSFWWHGTYRGQAGYFAISYTN
jgi:hypothetical protein